MSQRVLLKKVMHFTVHLKCITVITGQELTQKSRPKQLKDIFIYSENGESDKG